MPPQHAAGACVVHDAEALHTRRDADRYLGHRLVDAGCIAAFGAAWFRPLVHGCLDPLDACREVESKLVPIPSYFSY